MIRIIHPAFYYALAVFAVGFILGTIRVLLIVPRFGEGPAVLAEIPIMIAVSYFFARRAVARWEVAPSLAPRLMMGAVAFLALMVLELLVSLVFFGNSVSQHLAHYADIKAWPGLAGQLVFAALPALLIRIETP